MPTTMEDTELLGLVVEHGQKTRIRRVFQGTDHDLFTAESRRSFAVKWKNYNQDGQLSTIQSLLANKKTLTASWFNHLKL